MKRVRRDFLIGFCLVLGGLLFLPPIPRPVTGEDESIRARAKKLFDDRCASCHLVPDPAHASDRAWLQQVQDTA